MQLLGLIESFKHLTQFTEKVMSVEGEGAISIEEMEQMIKDGFKPNHLVFGVKNNTENRWEYAHVTTNQQGYYITSSDMPHTGIKDIITNSTQSTLEAITAILKRLVDE
ncbi:hypothetical protein [Paraglaciecola chathamensis]|uniref:Uncharacterized protein n=1 Tax=Paraglaciecola agarilytica NO2 TaxID=1125747 RepID=A0ABQ0I1Z3_9ALTE|nr:hypothetical protein [Paraglaciecola agarilytica]GAC03350.1 hypothetical protein GAGA_0485 [Paraglaciecola agarilytica NO2]